jgi:hypothetical protein
MFKDFIFNGGGFQPTLYLKTQIELEKEFFFLI